MSEMELSVLRQRSLEALKQKARRGELFMTVAIGYVRGGTVLEVAAHDPRQGVVFYTLDQTAENAPRFKRNDGCLACHLSWTTLGVPGLFVLSMQTLPECAADGPGLGQKALEDASGFALSLPEYDGYFTWSLLVALTQDGKVEAIQPGKRNKKYRLA